MIKDKKFGVVYASLLADGNHGKLDDQGRETMEFTTYVKKPGITSKLELVEKRERVPIEYFNVEDVSSEIMRMLPGI